MEFPELAYAQCWEDADVLLPALAVRPGATVLSIASGGENTLALLTADPARVIALDRNPAQLACLALKMAAFRELDHAGLLELVGSRDSDRRPELYARCRSSLPQTARDYWDRRPREVAAGIGSAGRFERYFKLFRTWVLPWVHGRADVRRLLAGGDRAAREAFHRDRWNTPAWRWMFRVFFSKRVMRLGRRGEQFRHVKGGIADAIRARSDRAVTELDPADNPYLHMILTGRHGAALPTALQAEHFETIRNRLDRIEPRCADLAAFLEHDGTRLDGANLSDVFEYVDEFEHERLLRLLIARVRPGCRLVYWNMMVPRSRPTSLADRLRPLEDDARSLHARDRAFFYSRLVIEEVV